jgi:hypothetical protein
MSGDVECPDGDTRGVRELVVKLIVAHLTAVVAFCNLQSLREERLASIEPVLFLLSPFMVIFQTALGLLAFTPPWLSAFSKSPNFGTSMSASMPGNGVSCLRESHVLRTQWKRVWDF